MASPFAAFGVSLVDWTGITTDEQAIWAERVEHLNDLWAWYDGTRLREEDEALPMDRRTGKRPLRYPLQINLVAPAARAHSFALWGEVEDTSESLVRTIVEPPFDEVDGTAPTVGHNGHSATGGSPADPGFPALPRSPVLGEALINNYDRPDPANVTSEFAEVPPPDMGQAEVRVVRTKEAARKLAKQAERAISNVLYENNSRSMFTDLGLTTQVLAGCVLKLGWDPANPLLPSGIRLEYVDPRDFHPRFRGKDYWNLTEAWIKLNIAGESAAQEFGVYSTGKVATYVEYWSRGKFWIKVNGEIATVGGVRMEMANPFGFVPIIYIPHERRNSFWGTSMVEDTIGLTREINARLADMGDAVHLSIKRILWAKNIKGGHPVKKEMAGVGTYWDYGRAISQGDPQPDLQAVASPVLPQGADKFQAALLELARTHLITPSIVYGEEEGSQRSGQTLYQRMWPLLSHVRQERTHWTTGLNLLAEMILRMLAAKGRAGITTKHLGLRKRQRWASMVPVDREMYVDEMIRRLQENAVSRRKAVEGFGDVSDIEEELVQITADMEQLAKLQLLAKPQAASQPKPSNEAQHSRER